MVQLLKNSGGQATGHISFSGGLQNRTWNVGACLIFFKKRMCLVMCKHAKFIKSLCIIGNMIELFFRKVCNDSLLTGGQKHQKLGLQLKKTGKVKWVPAPCRFSLIYISFDKCVETTLLKAQCLSTASHFKNFTLESSGFAIACVKKH